MKGFVKIEAVNTPQEGFTCEVNVQDVSVGDRLHMLHCLCQGLQLDEPEIEMYRLLRKLGVFERTLDQIKLPMDDSSAFQKLLNTLVGGASDEG